MMAVTHIVLIVFTPETVERDRKEVAIKIQGLKSDCIHPQTGKPYILSMRAGLDMSTEGCQDGITHAFISNFSTIDDRDYCVKKDPVHVALVQAVKSKLKKIQVVDFVEGELV